MEEEQEHEKEENLEDRNDEDPKVTRTRKLTLFLRIHWRGLVCLISPLILLPVLSPFPPEKSQWCAYTLLVMAIFWVTECIPLPVTSFIPVIVFPMAGVMDTRHCCRCYINDTVFMFFGSMVLACAVEQSGLHKRLALFTIRLIGYSHYRLLFAMSFTTMFVSMWITNTAATTMMVPINFALLSVFEEQNLLEIYELDDTGEQVASDITTCYFCAVSFSATIGGIGTLVGTATNLVFKGLFQKAFPAAPEYLSFPKLSAFSIPYMFAMEICLYLALVIGYLGFLRPKSKDAILANISESGKLAAKNAVHENWRNLGRITFWEIMVVILFGGAMVMFFCRSPQIFVGWGDIISDYFELHNNRYARDSAAAMLVGFLMMLLPSTLEIFKNCTAKVDELPNRPVRSVLNWSLMNEQMPYSFMFLLGGGIALSEAAKKEYSDLNGEIGKILRNLNGLPVAFILLLIIIFTVFVTNFASNVAVCNVVAPIAMQLAKEIKFHPLWFNIAAGFAASYCFCLPVGTPGNLVVQSAASIPTVKMIKAGIVPSITTVLLTWLCTYYWAPVVWPDLHSADHEWIH
ncbi:protein I'm not dead yet-like [Trichoplusia ni]|uniref:Protein I'm not dead yet-like n=1 Tax=Trichoplusia ni TaxID=7111 RepID=A0A7E5V9U9_TRINI|nr:protein I'm not dead yet-like [Trichoplusia ni]